MPYYSELGIYTPSSSYTSPLLKGPYSSHSSILASNILPPSSKQFSRSNFRGFKPHLTTISESNLGVPLRRISSPKVIYHTSPKVRVPRPIKINTSDINVSLNKYSKSAQLQPRPQRTFLENEAPSTKKESSPVVEKEAKPNTEIRRDRATIRLQTIHKDTLEKEIGQITSWRDNFKPDELVVEAKRRKKSPGEILKEKFLIRSKSKENVPNLETPKLSRKLSVKKSPSFKDICDVITSDQVVEDLNPGQPFEVRRRQSRQVSHEEILKEIQRSSSTLSVEEIQILDALLQAETEVGLYDTPPVIDEQPKSLRKKKVTKKKSSENLDIKNVPEPIVSDEVSHPKKQLTRSSSDKNVIDSPSVPQTRLRKDSSLKNMVKDISQVEIEMIPVKQKRVITGYIGSIEEKVKNNLRAVVGDLEVDESPKQEVKEKKFRFNVTVQEFPVKKKINFPKCELSKDNYSTVQIPNAKVPVVTSILKKQVDKCVGHISGDGQIKEKRLKPKNVKKTLEKSFSEIQVRDKEENLVKKSESNDSVYSNFTVMVNRAASNESLENSRHSSGKLKIISIENRLDKTDKKVASDNNTKSDITKQIIPRSSTVNSKEEATKTVALLKTTKKELKPDTFLSKRELDKKPDLPNFVQPKAKGSVGKKQEEVAKKEVTVKKPEVCDTNNKNEELDLKPIAIDASKDNVLVNDNLEKIDDKDIPIAKNLDRSTENRKIEDLDLTAGDVQNIVKNDNKSLKENDLSKLNESLTQSKELTKNEDKSKLNDSLPQSKELTKNEGTENKDKSKLNNFLDQSNKLTKNEDTSKLNDSLTQSKELTKNEGTENEDQSKLNTFLEQSKELTKNEDKSKLNDSLTQSKELTKNEGTENKDKSKLNTFLEQSKELTKNEDKSKLNDLLAQPKELTKNESSENKTNDKECNFWEEHYNEKYTPPKLSKLKLELKDSKALLKEIHDCYKEPIVEEPETPEEKERRMISKRSLIQKANKSDPDLRVFEPPTPPPPEPVKEPSPEPSFVPLQSNRLSQWMHPWKKPEQQDQCPLEIYAKPKFIRGRHIPRRWKQETGEDSDSEDSTTSEENSSNEDSEDESEEEEEIGAQTKIGASTSSNDSGFDSGRAKNKDSIDSRDSPGNTLNPASNPAFALDFNDLPEEVCQSSTYQSFQRSGRITPPATTIPRFRKYCVDDFNFLKVLGKGSFGKVLLAELKGTEYYYAIKCLKKDVVLEDDDVECTLIERKVLALGTKHPYLCHLLCTFQTESHLFFVMEYLNGGDLMFHIQAERRFSEARARFYGAEIVSGLKFLHNKGIVYRDLKLDNILLDFDGHVRIADFGMCKLQIFLDRMADTFCGTPDYMAPEIIKGQHYNQCVDWWSFGVLLYEMLLGQSPFSGSDEDELFWSICNEKPVIPRFLSAEAGSVLVQFMEKDANKRLGNRFSPHGDIQDHAFFKPIDWAALEARRLEPPFKPNLQHPLDTQYFDKTFTTEKAKLTPIETGILQSMDQTQFQGFSYTNPNATDK